MEPSAPSFPVSVVLWALLLTLSSSSTLAQDWDNPTCTKGVVSVIRGQRAVMTCNISNNVSTVSIDQITPSKRAIFVEVTQRNISQDGWQLQVEGCMAQLVTEEAQDTQAGEYKWVIKGHQTNFEFTTLNVSEPQELHPTPSWVGAAIQEIPPQESQTEELKQPRDHSLAHLIVVIFLVILVLALGSFVWYRRRGFFRHLQLQ